MNILAVGDVVGMQGCEFLRRRLPALKKLKGISLCIANGENSAAGNGITPESAEYLFACGVDFITTGNHAFRRAEMNDFFDSSEYVIRPCNYYSGCPGKGSGIMDMGRVRVGIINLSGSAFMENAENPFCAVDSELEKLSDCRIKLVDFHAEATGEKRALGFYLDGRVSAVFGTHTHVQTADEQILPNGTGYITDLGMTGVVQSVLGVKPEIIIGKLKTGMPARFDFASGDCTMSACVFEIDDRTGKTTAVERLNIA